MGSRSERQALRDLVAAVAPLVDPAADIVQPFGSAWEINTYSHDPRAADGEELHKRLAEAYQAAENALKPAGQKVTITDVRPPPPQVRIVPVPLTHEAWLRT